VTSLPFAPEGTRKTEPGEGAPTPFEPMPALDPVARNADQCWADLEKLEQQALDLEAKLDAIYAKQAKLRRMIRAAGVTYQAAR
jgi:hypothetical protein